MPSLGWRYRFLIFVTSVCIAASVQLPQQQQQQQQEQQEEENPEAIYLTLENLSNGSLCCRLNDTSGGRVVDCTGCGLRHAPLLHPDVRPGALLLARNRIRALKPGTFINASGLNRLDLSANPRLARLTAGCLAGAADSLLELDLSGTGLSDSAWEGLEGLPRLRRLRMAGLRQLDSLPAQLGGLAMLLELDVSDGGLSVIRAGDFPPGGKLELLRLTRTQLYRLEAAAFDPLGDSLRQMEVSAPTLGRTLVTEADSVLPGAWNQVLRRLPNLNNLLLSSYPPVLNCTEDDNDRGRVKGLTDQMVWPAVWPLRNLRRLVLDGNCLSRAPPSLGRELLPELRELSLADNPFVCVCGPTSSLVPPIGVSGIICATLEAVLLGQVDPCPTLRQQATTAPVLQSTQPPSSQPHAGLIIATSIVTSLTFLAAVAAVAVIVYYRRFAVAASSAMSAAASSEAKQIEVYAEYERPIGCGSGMAAGGDAYEVINEPSPPPPLPLPTRAARRFFRRSERPQATANGEQPPAPPPPLPPRTPAAPPAPPPRQSAAPRPAGSGAGGIGNAAYAPADDKASSDTLVIVGRF